MVITRSLPPIKLDDNGSNNLDDHWGHHMPGAYLAIKIIIHNILI